MKRFLISILLLYTCNTVYAQSCSIKVPNMNFGQYNPFLTQNNLSSMNITVSCNKKMTYIMSANNGISNNMNDRQMQNGSKNSILHYNLYKDNSYTTIFGNGLNNVLISNGTTTTIYGSIPALQNVIAGSYADNLQIQIIF